MVPIFGSLDIAEKSSNHGSKKKHNSWSNVGRTKARLQAARRQKTSTQNNVGQNTTLCGKFKELSFWYPNGLCKPGQTRYGAAAAAAVVVVDDPTLCTRVREMLSIIGCLRLTKFMLGWKHEYYYERPTQPKKN